MTLYRCQAPDPDCDCSECRRERWLQAHPKFPRPRPPAEPIRVDSRGVKWYRLSVPDDQMR